MDILWICGSRVIGGAERVHLKIGELLLQRGHAFEVLCPQRSALNGTLAEARLPVRHGGLGGSLNVRALFDISRSLMTLRPHVALVTTSDEWVWASLSIKPPHTRLVFVRHMALPLPRLVQWLSNERAHAIIAPSRAVRESLIGQGIIRQECVHIIHNPVRLIPRSDPPLTDDRTSARDCLGVPRSGRCVGFFGGLNPKKGIRDVVWAVRKASEYLGEIHLLVCGGPPTKGNPPAEYWAGKLGPEGHFHYLGEVPLKGVQKAMTAVEVVVLATHMSLKEGFPLTILEAMACGTPVIAYKTGGVPELVGPDGKAGLLVPPEDLQSLSSRIREVLSDPNLAHSLAANGLVRVRERYMPEPAADRYERLFKELIS